MNDKELLELAAKAAGILLEWDGDPNEWQPMYYDGKTYHIFNPSKEELAIVRSAEEIGKNMQKINS